ncbi:MAG: hypothetical protein QOD06_1488 [Candidatus Binatota bacterium]|jgi:small-conductance mechanosensitive channel/CRP-like cAMP-binding protein|nr:hypothetical protein [Candidatus Binatota bacterium]
MSATSPFEGVARSFLGLGHLGPVAQTAVGFALCGLVAIGWLALRRREDGRRFGGAVVFLAASFVFESLLPWLPVGSKTAMTLHALALLCFCFGLVRGVVVAADLAARRKRSHFSTIFRDLVTLLLYGIIVLVVLRVTVAVDVTPLLATSALVTAVIGLALQETLGNVFSGLSLQTQKPFEPGDWIRFGGYLGRVQGIGWRSTGLVTRSLELLDVPNAQLAREVITNYRGRAVGDELFVAAAYDSPPNHVKAVILEVLRSCAEIVESPPPQAWVVDYGDFAIKYRLRFWMVDYAKQDLVRDEVMTSVWYAFRRNGIEIPYPIRDVRVHDAAAGTRGRDELARERVEALRRVDFLRELDDEELGVLASSVAEIEFGRGEIVFREGETGDTFFLIRRGTLEVVTGGANGVETHVADLTPSAFFGEMSLLSGEPRSATIRAKTDATLLVVEREGFEQLFRQRPGFAEGISRVVAERQEELRQRREQHAATDGVEGRSRRLLARMHAIFGF